MADGNANEFGFHLSKCGFRDVLALRYGWPICDVPAVCTAARPSRQLMQCVVRPVASPPSDTMRSEIKVNYDS